ncbi:hypothetical protein SE18_08990 [Herpetosiphon geysericola]|uniref:Uncharacterized protein n=1 Tax=Herpetosiphon geysericola TaxID=70996 RepID=A0A0P6Y7M1_9CHLR|nr:hypothetical protein SE18_08990 [Herpetosiphon geysericola]
MDLGINTTLVEHVDRLKRAEIKCRQNDEAWWLVGMERLLISTRSIAKPIWLVNSPLTHSTRSHGAEKVLWNVSYARN